MPERSIVINTGPLLALICALDGLEILNFLYHRVLVPYEVSHEIMAGGKFGYGIAEFDEATWLQRWPSPLKLTPLLANSLDKGEAAVIQLALNEGIKTVCIDEANGRRVARLNGLSVTGSIGILLRAKQEGFPLSIRTAMSRMQSRGIWLSERVVRFALSQAGETP